MSPSLFGRKEEDSIVLTTELIILYCMLHDQKMDICYALTVKLRDLSTKTSGVIKIGGLVTTIANYLSFDTKNMSFDKIKGHSLIDINMMEAIRLIRKDHRGRAIINRPIA